MSAPPRNAAPPAGNRGTHAANETGHRDDSTPVRLNWDALLLQAAQIVNSYDTPVTLRQLFYRLVAAVLLPNTRSAYTRLSSYTAAARREGWFPALLDQSSRIERYQNFDGTEDARQWLRSIYRRDRTAGQVYTILLGVEKGGLSAQLAGWFTEPLGIPHVALGGYASQSLVDQVRGLINGAGKPSVLIYAGDHDPSGRDIQRDFVERVDKFDHVIRVALDPDQVVQYSIPFAFQPEVMEKLNRDTRAAAFVKQWGSLVQYEVDALPPDVLRDLYRNAIDAFWDARIHDGVLDREAEERAEL